MQVIKDHFLQVGLHFLHLSENDAALALDLGLSQRAVLNDVRQDFHRCRQRRSYHNAFLPVMTSLCLRFTSGQIFGESFSVVHRLLSGGVRVQVSSLVLDLQLQLRSLPGALRHSYRCDAFYTIVLISRHTRTLKAMCSRKWAVPLLCSFSYRLPASIHRPTCIM